MLGGVNLRASTNRSAFYATAGYFVAALIAIFWGLAISFTGELSLLLVLTAIFGIFILRDFRVGVVMLIVLLPLSATSLYPHQLLDIKGFNPPNLLFAATFGSYLIYQISHSRKFDFVPWQMLFLYILPIFVAALIGSAHVDAIPQFFKQAGLINFNDPAGYVRDMFVKPMFLVLLALMVAAAIKASSNPEKLLWPVVVSLWSLVIFVVTVVALSGASLDELAGSESRGFLSIVGIHANDLGVFFNMGYAIALFTFARTDKVWVKRLALFSLIAAAVCVMLTFSRAGYISFLVTNLVYLLSRRQFKTLLAAVLLTAIVAVLIPQAVIKRAMTGVAEGDRGAISAGRIDDIWEPLLPTILDQPLLGHGLSSTLWSEPMVRGHMAPVGHPHSAYLGALLDFGVIGTIAVFLFFGYVWRGLRRLRKTDESITLRGFFEGASVALLVLFVQGLTGGRFTPTLAQTFLWIAIGFLYARGGFNPKSKQDADLAAPDGSIGGTKNNAHNF